MNALYLGLVLVVALMLAGCGDGELDDSVAEPPGIPAPIDPAPPRLPPDGEGEGGDGGAAESCDPPSRISWSDAGDYLGREVALLGPVESVEAGEIRGESGTLVVMGNSDGAARPVTVFIPERIEDRFPEVVLDQYEESAVCVIGVLNQSGDQFVIVINGPADIVLV